MNMGLYVHRRLGLPFPHNFIRVQGNFLILVLQIYYGSLVIVWLRETTLVTGDGAKMTS